MQNRTGRELRDHGGENPLWDAAEQALYVHRQCGHARCIAAPGGRREYLRYARVITTLVLRQGGGALSRCAAASIYSILTAARWSWSHPLADPPPYVFNDGKVDQRGRFLIGACTANFADPTPDGGLWRLDPDHRLHQLDSDIHFSNGPCFSPDGKTFYFSDSWLHDCYAYDYDIETG